MVCILSVSKKSSYCFKSNVINVENTLRFVFSMMAAVCWVHKYFRRKAGMLPMEEGDRNLQLWRKVYWGSLIRADSRRFRFGPAVRVTPDHVKLPMFVGETLFLLCYGV